MIHYTYVLYCLSRTPSILDDVTSQKAITYSITTIFLVFHLNALNSFPAQKYLCKTSFHSIIVIIIAIHHHSINDSRVLF